MIGPEDERPKDGSGAFEDDVTVELSDLDRRICALLRVRRTAGGADESGLALACVAGETVAALEEAEMVGFETLEPLARWRCRVERDPVALEAEVVALSSPIELDAWAGVQRYEQLCRVRGMLHLEGRATEIDGVGRRTHAWGEPVAAGLRSLYAVAGDQAVTVTAIRPPGSEGHGDEIVAAYLVRPEVEPERFEEARLSTIYDAAGRPRTAGLELFLAGDEYPRRISGEAVCQVTGEREPLRAALFRWSLEGAPAQGGYHIAAAR